MEALHPELAVLREHSAFTERKTGMGLRISRGSQPS
jgi:hypothetical protein